MESYHPSPLELTQQSADQVCTEQILQYLTSMGVPFLLKEDPDWELYANSYNVRLPYKPLLIVIPEDIQNISDAVKCASNHGITVQAKCGGHSYASFSNGGTDGAIVIHLCKLRDVLVDQDTGIAKVGGGTRLGPLSLALWAQGRRAVAHGTCSAVGIGGHYTHGGYGHFSRAWGLAMDQILAMDVVLADGSLVHANKDNHTDVFYVSLERFLVDAMRGAADMIGIAVNFYLQTRFAPEKVIKWDIDLSSVAPIKNIDTATDTFMHLQTVATDASVVDQNISFGVVLGPGSWFNVTGIYLGSLDDFNNIATEILRGTPKPYMVIAREMSWMDTLRSLGGDDLTVTDPHLKRSNFYAKSITIPEPGASRDSIKSYMGFIASVGQEQKFSWYAILDLYGGPGSQINTKNLEFAAYRDRNSMWVAQHQAYVNNDAVFPGEGTTFLNALNGALTQKMDTHGAYLPYVDSEYNNHTASRMYYGKELHARLQRIKDNVDPKNVFANPHSIRPSCVRLISSSTDGDSFNG